MAGLLAAHMLRRYSPTVVERQSRLPNNHTALLRFRSPAVSDATSIPFSRVLVRKGIWDGEEVRNELLHEVFCAQVEVSASRNVLHILALRHFPFKPASLVILVGNRRELVGAIEHGWVDWPLAKVYLELCHHCVPAAGLFELDACHGNDHRLKAVVREHQHKVFRRDLHDIAIGQEVALVFRVLAGLFGRDALPEDFPVWAMVLDKSAGTCLAVFPFDVGATIGAWDDGDTLFPVPKLPGRFVENVGGSCIFHVLGLASLDFRGLALQDDEPGHREVIPVELMRGHHIVKLALGERGRGSLLNCRLARGTGRREGFGCCFFRLLFPRPGAGFSEGTGDAG